MPPPTSDSPSGPSCGGCAAKWGAAPLAALVRELAGRWPIPRCSSASRRSTTRRSTGSATTSPWCRPQTSSLHSSMTRATSARSQRRTRAATCSRWAGALCMALNISAFPERLPRRGDQCDPRGRRRGRSREAGGVIAGGHTIRSPTSRSSAWRCRASSTPTASSRKGGARPGDALMLSKPLGTGVVLAGGSDPQKARGDRADAHAQPGRVGGVAARWVMPCMRSPT